MFDINRYDVVEIALYGSMIEAFGQRLPDAFKVSGPNLSESFGVYVSKISEHMDIGTVTIPLLSKYWDTSGGMLLTGVIREYHLNRENINAMPEYNILFDGNNLEEVLRVTLDTYSRDPQLNDWVMELLELSRPNPDLSDHGQFVRSQKIIHDMIMIATLQWVVTILNGDNSICILKDGSTYCVTEYIDGMDVFIV